MEISLGRRIRAIRRHANLTQSAVAARLGLAVPTLSRYETGRCEIPSSFVEKFVQLFGGTVEELVAGPVASPVTDDTSLNATAMTMASLLHDIEEPETRGAVLRQLRDLVAPHIRERVVAAERSEALRPSARAGAATETETSLVLFDSQLQETLVAQLRQDMVRSEGNLRLHYQPIVDAMTGALLGFEALLRWQTLCGEQVPPRQVFGIAAQAGLVQALDFWVLQEASIDTAMWVRTRPNLIINVNISGGLLGSSHCVNAVRDVLRGGSTAPHSLCIEVLEELILDQPTTDNILALRRLGVRLAIDDFGTGRSNLARVLELKFDSIKLDQSFFAGRALDEAAVDFLCSVVRMAHQRGATVIAEGVTNEFDAALAKQLGCDACQGVWFSEALTAEMAWPLVIQGGLLPRPRGEPRLIPTPTAGDSRGGFPDAVNRHAKGTPNRRPKGTPLTRGTSPWSSVPEP